MDWGMAMLLAHRYHCGFKRMLGCIGRGITRLEYIVSIASSTLCYLHSVS